MTIILVLQVHNDSYYNVYNLFVVTRHSAMVTLVGVVHNCQQ